VKIVRKSVSFNYVFQWGIPFVIISNIIFLCCYFMILFLLSRKESHKLGEKYKKGIPIEVIPMAYCPVQQKIEALYGGLAELRMGKMKAVCCFIYFGICELMHVLWTISLNA
jgi:Ribose 5-phosphate isomerase